MVQHATGVPTGQVKIVGGDEIRPIATGLDRIDRGDVTVARNTVHAQRAHIDCLHRGGEHSLLVAEANRPTLRSRCQALLSRSVPARHVSHAKGHGRLETPTLQVVRLTRPRLSSAYAREAIRMTRQRVQITAGAISSSVVCAVPDRLSEVADIARPAALGRLH